MATFRIYKCTKCSYEVRTEPSGYYALMFGEFYNYSCPKCRQIVSIKQDFGALPSEKKPRCPECGSKAITKWNPVRGKCPKCSGKMEVVPDLIIMAD